MNCPELAATELGCVASETSPDLETGLRGDEAELPNMWLSLCGSDSGRRRHLGCTMLLR
jgi:hypothetical protein